MRAAIAFALLAGVLLLIGVVVCRQHRPQPIAVVQAAAPACVPPASHYLWKQRRIA